MVGTTIRIVFVLAVCVGLGSQARAENRIVPSIGDAADSHIRLAAGGGGGSTQTIDKERPASAPARDQQTRALIAKTWTDLATKQAEIGGLEALATQRRMGPQEIIRDVLYAGGRTSDRFDCGTALFSGFRYLYCLVRNFVTLEKVRSLAGMSVFRDGGPHQGDLNWRSSYSFGYYNPAFLSWLDKYLIPDGRHDAKFNQLTQAVYETYLRRLVRALYHSHEILFASAQDFEIFKTRYESVGRDYRARLARREVNESRFGANDFPRPMEDIKSEYLRRLANRTDPENAYFLGESYRWLSDYLATEKNDDWYLANTAGGFWVRRSIDGTEAQIFGLLRKLMQTFDPGRL